MDGLKGSVTAGLLWAAAAVLVPAAGFAQPVAPAPAPDVAPLPGSPEAAAPPRAGSAPASQGRRGLLGDLGDLFERPAAWPSVEWPPAPVLKSPAEAIEDFNARARNAGDSLSRLGRGPVVTGRAVCFAAANGAPDCEAAAARMCRDKGFAGGKSADVEAAQVCSARALLSRRTNEPGACHMENYVTRAVCN